MNYIKNILYVTKNLPKKRKKEGPMHHSKLKYIEVDVHFTRNQVKAGTIRLQFVSTREQLADIFTKGLCSPQHIYLCHGFKPSSWDVGCQEYSSSAPQYSVHSQP